MNRFLQIFRIPDLRKKVVIVVGLLVAYRVLAAIPIPGVDGERLRAFFESSQLFGFLNLFSGGGLENLSVAMLGVGPYITGTIIMQLLTMIFPKFKEMYYEEGARGQAKFNQWARILTVPLGAMQAYGFLNILAAQGAIDKPAGLAAATAVAAITAGSLIALWLGELISEQKIGNGISLIILAGIVSRLPQDASAAFAAYTPALLPVYVGFFIAILIIIAGVVYLNEGERKIPIAYARRVRGNKLWGGASSYLPLKVNQAGMIPLIFAISVLLFPQFIAQMVSLVNVDIGVKMNEWITWFLANRVYYGTFYFLLVFAFTYFYTSITFNAEEVAKNLQRSGGFIPGIRPGEGTSQYFSNVVNRVTLFGATFLGLIAILPFIIEAATGISVLTVSGTALLIVVAVCLETMRQINSQLTVREYEGF